MQLPLAIVMWISFGPLKPFLQSSKNCGCETFRVLKYLLSIVLLYTHPCNMILSKQKCCLLLNGVSTESQKLTSVRQIRRDLSPTREKGRDLTKSCDKSLYSHRKVQKVTWQHKNATKNFDYTTIADRLRTVSRVTAVTPLVWLNRFTCEQPSH